MRKTILTSTGLAVLIGLGGVTVAQAQTAPAQPEAAPEEAKPTDGQKPEDPTTTVTVQGKKSPNRIDRQVYDNKGDIDSQTGTASDALSKVPSVNVDPNGNVTLRGNSNVQVYIDGKPSVMMQGDNRAGALQSMSSGDIDSIEVMTNPGAQFSSEGSGGIINLVMRRNRKPGNSGSINANVGDGRYNAAINGARNTGKYTISGGLNLRHDTRPSRTGSILQRFDGDGDVLNTTQQSGNSDGGSDNVSATAGLDYNLNEKDTLGAQMSWSHRKNTGTSDETYATYDAAGALQSGYRRHSDFTGPSDDFGFGIRWDHTGEEPGETLKTDLRLGRSTGNNQTDAVFFYPDVPGFKNQTRTSDRDFRNAVLSLDYVRPFDQAQLTTGFQITYDDNSFRNTATGLNSAGLNNAFAYQQTLSAGYFTWQTPVGEKWTVMGGLRVESLDLETHQGATTSHINYTKFNPSAFAAYTLSDTAKLRFSYSHRLRRPNPQDLNPFETYIDPQNVNKGNPDLKPEESDSFEAGYEKSGQAINYQVRAYYRKSRDSITSYSFVRPAPTPADQDIIVTTKRNFGEGQSGGLEGNFNGKLTPKFSLNANANLAFIELDVPDTGGARQATTLSGRVSFDYQVAEKDRLQLSFFSRGKQLTGQGYTAPFGMGNFSYRHQFTPKAAAVVTVNDLFRSGKFRTVVDTDSLYSESYRGLQGQTIMIGLSYTLGGNANSNNQPQDGQRGRGGWDGQRGGGGGNWGGPGGM